LAPGSDDIDELRMSLMAYSGLDQFGRSRAAGRGRRTGRKQLASRAGLAPIIPLRPLSA